MKVCRIFTLLGAEKVPDANMLARLSVQNVLWGGYFKRFRAESLESRTKRVGERTNNAAGYDGKRYQHSRSVRQQPFARRHTVAHADDEEDRQDCGNAGEWVRDRMRSVGRRMMEVARITRTKWQKTYKRKTCRPATGDC